MKHASLPRLEIGSRPGLRSDVSTKALMHWAPDLRAARAEDAATIQIMEPIGEDFFAFEGGVTARKVAAALRSIGPRPVSVEINSPGGDVFEGIAIYNLLRDHPEQVTVKVLGLAASAASLIAMAGDRVEIGRAGFLMIHNAWVIAMGDAPALRASADWLEPFDAAMAGVYAARSGLDEADLRRMMAEELWMNGEAAIEAGFADALLPADAVTTGADVADARALRAEKRFDILAARNGMSRSAARELLAEIRGATRDAGPTGKPEAAAETEAALRGLLHDIRSIGG